VKPPTIIGRAPSSLTLFPTGIPRFSFRRPLRLIPSSDSRMARACASECSSKARTSSIAAASLGEARRSIQSIGKPSCAAQTSGSANILAQSPAQSFIGPHAAGLPWRLPPGATMLRSVGRRGESASAASGRPPPRKSESDSPRRRPANIRTSRARGGSRTPRRHRLPRKAAQCWCAAFRTSRFRNGRSRPRLRMHVGSPIQDQVLRRTGTELAAFGHQPDLVRATQRQVQIVRREQDGALLPMRQAAQHVQGQRIWQGATSAN